MRPRVRGDCMEGGSLYERPCPFVSCKHHLYLDVNPENGSIKFNFPDFDPEEMEFMAATCALDVADDGEHTLEMVGDLINLTRERVRQVEVKAMMALRPELDDDAE